MKTILLLQVFVTSFVFCQKDSLKDTVNVTDAAGMRQGEWMLLGSDVPEFGIESGSIAETGTYQNNQKVGPWIRYNKTGTQPISLIIYEFNPNGKESTRVSIFSYKYHENGQVSYLPYAGKCKTKANYKRFDAAGNLLEMMEYDAAGNEVYSITATDQSALSSMSYFKIPENYSSYKEEDIRTPEYRDVLAPSGVYIIDYNHSKFICGKFTDGILVEGTECVLDETYSLVSARVFKNYGYVSSYKQP